MDKLPTALTALGNYNHFIIWKPVPVGAKITKKPVNAHTGIVHDPHDPAIWMSANDAIAALQRFPGYGLGFVFSKLSPFWFIDIDDCLEPSGQWSQVALNICTKFQGCAIEVSQSGTGLHIFGTGEPPPHGCRNKPLGLEFYDDVRFVALTGDNTMGDAGALAPIGALDWLVATYFQPGAATVAAENFTSTPVPEWSGPTDDDLLIMKMLGSKSPASIFGNKASIRDLWTADPEVLGKFYPEVGDKSRGFGWSEAEAALCSHLAFWTGKDCERIDRLMRRSGLYRDKWEKRQPYRESTILKAVGGCSAVYGDRPKIEPKAPVTIQQTATPAAGTFKPEVKDSFLQFLTPDQQLEHFKGCVYITALNKIFTPGGHFLKSEQFKATYGGYIFALDGMNDKTTKNAWEAFTESQAINFPKAMAPIFRPALPPLSKVFEENQVLVNTYVSLNIPRVKGDVSPFLDLMYKLFPAESDRDIILAYIAACVQYPGVKFQWAPLIQGCEGNGKSFLSTSVSRAVGVRYTHKPPAKDIGNVFNAWITNKIFINVEEVYVNDNREVMDALKTLISDSKVPVTPKGVDQITGDNCANFLCTTNHKNAIRVARKNNRRWCIFYTPQQSYDDMLRDGMTGNYFPNLYNWANQGGYAIITDYLLSYDIPEARNPATMCHRAPITTSADDIITATLGGIEQDIIEAIGEGRRGFAGGWVSSIALSRLLEKRRITHHKRAEILSDLGYKLHPGLVNGRVHSSIIIDDGKKPRLWIKDDSPYAEIMKAADITKQYLIDQGVIDIPVNNA